MKKILFCLLMLLFLSPHALAEDYLFTGSIEFNWDEITQEEREENIKQMQTNIFGENLPEKKIRMEDFKTKYKDYLKDKDYKKHYMVAAAGYKEYKDYNISAMYFKKMSSLYMYGLQKKDDPTTIYYYDALGNLRYVDNIKGLYPQFPYYAEQYRRSGVLAGVSYFTSKETQYIFKGNGEFKGVWNQYKFYDKKGKVIMQRSNY